jgi:hypothetical protein
MKGKKGKKQEIKEKKIVLELEQQQSKQSREE